MTATDTLPDARPARDVTGPAGAVILGGAHGSLAVARSLGRHGIPVWFVTHDHPIARYSHYVTRSLTWAGPDDAAAVPWLLDLAAGLDRWVLFAGGDAEVRFLAQNHAALAEGYRVASPPWPVARITCDKQLTNEHATSIGLVVPWSFYPRSRDDLAAIECRFPVILKPTVNEGRNAFTAAKAWRIDDRAALLSCYDEAAALVGPDAIMLQELIPGGGEAQFSYAGVWRNGVPVASLVARRTRQYPIDFGFTSTFVETIEQAEVEAAACRFLSALRYDGLAEIEFKYDARDRRYKLLDVNSRPWTWIALGTAAGVDFPLIQWRLSVGEAVAQQRGRAGCGWLHASRDFAAACRLIVDGKVTPSEYLASLWRTRVFAAFAADDPLPGIVDLPVVLARVLTRRYRETPAPAVELPRAKPATLL
jgi:predicted ATP-grasp superfamily ATP-dependent carboligase